MSKEDKEKQTEIYLEQMLSKDKWTNVYETNEYIRKCLQRWIDSGKIEVTTNEKGAFYKLTK